MLDFGMCSTGISGLNWKSTTEAIVARESVSVLGLRDLFEVATGEFGFPSHDNLQARGHLIVFGCVFSVDLTRYE